MPNCNGDFTKKLFAIFLLAVTQHVDRKREALYDNQGRDDTHECRRALRLSDPQNCKWRRHHPPQNQSPLMGDSLAPSGFPSRHICVSATEPFARNFFTSPSNPSELTIELDANFKCLRGCQMGLTLREIECCHGNSGFGDAFELNRPLAPYKRIRRIVITRRRWMTLRY